MTRHIAQAKNSLSPFYAVATLLPSRISVSFLSVLVLIASIIGFSHTAFSELVIEKTGFETDFNEKSISIWGEYHPPLNGAKDDKNPGFMIEIAQSIFERDGYTIDYVLGPRSRGVSLVKNGDIDCVVNAKIKDHHFLAFPTEPWGYHAATLFALPSSLFQYKNMTQVKSMQLGAIAGMRYDNGAMDEYLNKRAENISFSYGENAMEKEIKMLLKERVELLVSCPLLMRGQLEAMGLKTDAIKIVGEIKPFVGMYLACGSGEEKTRRYIEMINEGIPALRKSGELAAILKKYGQIDWLDIYQSLDTPH